MLHSTWALLRGDYSVRLCDRVSNRMMDIDNLWASFHVIREIKSRKVRWMGVTAFSSLDGKSIKYLQRKSEK